MTEMTPSRQTAHSAPKAVFVRTYGCQMNAYDSERMTGLLKPLGYRSVASPEAADLVILNTCHIREKAAQKVYSDLGRLNQLKRDRRAAGGDLMVAVAGCVAQAEGVEITDRAPIVDLVFGPQAYHRLPEMLARAARSRGDILDTDFTAEEKFDHLSIEREVEGPTAFLTIQEGCDKFCTFCVVPYTRGVEVSRPVDSITAEAVALVARGVREITLLGQNVNAWRSAPPDGQRFIGVRANQDGSWGLGQLCRHLASIEGLERLRFTTSHPRDMDDDLIDAFATVETLMPYLHLPVQSGSDIVLSSMNRGHTAKEYRDLIGRLRSVRSDLAVSSDFIVGFPTETTDAFESTLTLIDDIGFASSFSFKYSRRPGTPGAAMPKQVAEDIKEARLSELQALLESQRQSFNRQQVGKNMPVLFEKVGRHDGQLIGRSPYLQSVHAVAPLSTIGEVVSVGITGVTPNALAGTIDCDVR